MRVCGHRATLVAGRSRFDAAEVQNPSRDLGSANHVGWLATGAWRHTASPHMTLTHRLFLTGETYDNRNGLDEPVATGRVTDLGYRTDVAFVPAATRAVEAGWSIERLRTREQQAFRVPVWPIFGGEDFDARTTMVGAYGQVHRTVGRRGAATLAPDRAMHVDAGVEGLVGTKTRRQVTVYDREERNLVDLPDAYIRQVGGVLLPESSTSHYDNRLKGTSRGVEVMLQHKAADALSGWIAYSFGRTRSTDVLTGERFDGDFDQRHTISLVGRYRLSDRMSINTRWRYGSNRPMTGYIERHEDGQYFVGASRNAARVPTYARWDARVDRTYRWSNRRLTVFGEVANILNRENLRQIPPFVDFRTGQAFDLFRTMFPIVPSVGATLEF